MQACHRQAELAEGDQAGKEHWKKNNLAKSVSTGDAHILG